MAVYKMEIRNTQHWDDCRYRAYTSSWNKAALFQAKVAKIRFTDSGHGLVATVHEVPSRKKDTISILADYVRECLAPANQDRESTQ